MLGSESFTVTEGVADIPIAFTASFGRCKPVFGFLGEYDALDILSKEAGNPVKKPVKESAPDMDAVTTAWGPVPLQQLCS